jgi:hypothetical protein
MKNSYEGGRPPICFTIKEFCRSHRISVSSYYELRKLGLGPREHRVFSHVLITEQAAAEWRGDSNPDRSGNESPREGEVVV